MGKVNLLSKVVPFLTEQGRRLNPGKDFFNSRLTSILWGAVLAAATALCLRLFQSGVVATCFPKLADSFNVIFASLKSDQDIRIVSFVLICLVGTLLLPSITRKLVPLFRSWLAGLISFSIGAAFVTTLIAFWCPPTIGLGYPLGLILLLLVVEYALHGEREVGSALNPKITNEHRFERLFGPTGTEPISTFQEDLADRKSVVRALSKLVIEREEPIIALSAAWGTGKSSVLRLLQKELEFKAIIVQFNAWLPGTEVTFAKQLMGAIATECGKEYTVPGLERSLKAFAQLVAGSVKQLEVLKPFFPSDSQQDEIEKLISGINRVPKRIVVLIDEIDRMDFVEASVLLKILRGAPALSNITFVCAVDVKALQGKLKMEKHELEKFMPLTIRLQPPDPSILNHGLKVQFEKLIRDTLWSQIRPNGVPLSTQVSAIFNHSLQHQFSNFRALRSLVGRFRQIENKVLGEVNPLDLLLLVAIELRAPLVLDYIARRSSFFAEQSSRPSILQQTFDQVKNDEVKKLFDIASAEDSPEIIQILCELFPNFNKYCKEENNIVYKTKRDTNPQALRDERRVALSDFAWAYFRGFLHAETLSQEAFNSVLARLNDESSFALIGDELRSFAQSIESQVLLTDFWWRLARVNTFPQKFKLWAELARAIADTSDLYSRDGFGFSYHLGIGSLCVYAFWNVFEKIPLEEAQPLFSEVILSAPKDGFALQLTEDVEKKHSFDHVSVNQKLDSTLARQAFLDRMNRRYAASVLSQSFPDSYVALLAWANHSEIHKNACHEYFRTLLLQSPSELPRLVKVVFPAHTEWMGKEQESISHIFPLLEFRDFILKFPLDNLDEDDAAEVSRFKTIFGNDLDIIAPHDPIERLIAAQADVKLES